MSGFRHESAEEEALFDARCEQKAHIERMRKHGEEFQAKLDSHQCTYFGCEEVSVEGHLCVAHGKRRWVA